MPKLSTVKPREAARALERAGFSFVRQKGSHRIYLKGGVGVTLPWHSKDLRPGTLRHIIKQAGLSVEEFYQLLR